MKTALYPGTFDPLTNGHVDVIDRAARLFDRVIVGVADSAAKGTLFSVQERLEMIREVIASRPAVEVVSFAGLLAHEFERLGVDVVVRGVRLFQDFEFEYMMALMNRRLSERFDVIFLMPSAEYLSVSSTLIKDIHHHGGDVADLVPPGVERRLSRLRGTDGSR
jgi:pantetheine-phosphate adenylyltransferase